MFKYKIVNECYGSGENFPLNMELILSGKVRYKKISRSLQRFIVNSRWMLFVFIADKMQTKSPEGGEAMPLADTLGISNHMLGGFSMEKKLQKIVL